MLTELKHIAAHKGLMLTMIVTLLIPFAYSFCFLTSAWDPYGNTGKIPVAVVNEDRPAELQGTRIQAGADTVAQLRNDAQLEWHFVSAKSAKKGLRENKYYTVVTIPADFSRNAATVLDAQPKQMKLSYETNGSLNYVSEIISQVGADTLLAQIREKVTTAFTKQLFKQVGHIGTQIQTAADGANQVATGSGQLNDGLAQLAAKVPVLATGVIQLANGGTAIKNGLGQLYVKVPTLANGVNRLTNGGNQLQNGLAQLNGQVPGLRDGVGQLTAGGQQLHDGLGQLNGQVPALADGVSQLTNGGMQLRDGLQSLNVKLPGLTDGVAKLTAGGEQLATGLGTLNDQTPALANGVQRLLAGMQDLKYYTLDARDGNPNMPDAIAQMKAKMAKLVGVVETQNTLISAAFFSFDIGINPGVYGVSNADLGLAPGEKAYPLFHYEKAQTAAAAQTDKDIAALKASLGTAASPATQAALAKLEADYQASKSATAKAYQTAKNYLAYVKTSLNAKTTDAAGDPTGLIAALKLFRAKLTAMDNELNQAAISGHADYTTAVTEILNGLTELNGKVPALVDGVAKLNTGASQEYNGLLELNGQVPLLNDGVTKLHDGAVKAADGLTQLNGKVPALTTGVQDLYAGAAKEAAGLVTLNGKVPALSAGVAQLYAGSVQEAAGLTQLNASVPALSDGVFQLYTGSTHLASGLNALNGNVPTLSDGVTQLANGAQQLSAGSTQLASGLTDGAKQINKTKLTNLTAKMFAAPAASTHHFYTSVQNYGAALAPYVLALALFIAIVIFNFAYPMRRAVGDNRDAISWLAGKIAISSLVALGMALIEATCVLAMGLHVEHMLGFYGLTILFALAAMYLTQLLNLAFRGAGIFAALGLLTLSGSGGLFPAETVSPLFNAIQHALPMTYAINAYRQMITSGIAGATVALSLIILFLVAGISLALMIPAALWREGTSPTVEN